MCLTNDYVLVPDKPNFLAAHNFYLIVPARWPLAICAGVFMGGSGSSLIITMPHSALPLLGLILPFHPKQSCFGLGAGLSSSRIPIKGSNFNVWLLPYSTHWHNVTLHIALGPHLTPQRKLEWGRWPYFCMTKMKKKFSSDQLKNYDNFSLSDIMGDLKGAFSIFQKD